jgi:Spy/CpxP family protein refolding chaperone
VFAIVHGAEPGLRDQFKAVHKAREALFSLGHSAQYGEAAVAAQAQALGKAETQLALLRTRRDHDIYAVLTPGQQAQAAKGPGVEREPDGHRPDFMPR